MCVHNNSFIFTPINLALSSNNLYFSGLRSRFYTIKIFNIQLVKFNYIVILIYLMRAILFPGQGSQYVGMGEDIFNQSSTAQRTYESASEILGFNLQDISLVSLENGMWDLDPELSMMMVHGPCPLEINIH